MDATENAALVILLSSIMLLATSQIVMRLAFNAGFIWADELVRLLVFWLALVASIAAARSDRHIRVDAISHILPEKVITVARMVVDGFAAGICGLLAWHSLRFLLITRADGGTIFLNFPAWIAQSILPFAFILMACRFLLMSIAHGRRLLIAENEANQS
jgi:TRAP-type C4-dicarboxylate transport system permease small subunit